jgi:ferric-dicitrate binding protein FerR (iron transport regulator)
MRSMRAVTAVAALLMVGLIAIPTKGVADEQITITGEAREVKFEGGSLQIIPTEKGVFIVVGELVKGKPGNVVLLEGARTTQVKVAPHHHANVLVVHRAYEEELAKQAEGLQSTP